MKTLRFLLLFWFVITLDATRLLAGVTAQGFNDAPGSFYNYSATCMESSPSSRYMWYCKTQNSGKIIDCIYKRKATKNGSAWSWGGQLVALAPGASNVWNRVRVCDPAVVRGKFLNAGANLGAP